MNGERGLALSRGPDVRLAMTLFLIVAACARTESASEAPPVGDSAAIVTGLMDAFNAHDPDAMREYWDENVTWIELSGAQAQVVTSSADQLYEELVAYFETIPSVRSSLENISVNGDYVSAVERPVWQQDGETKSQASIVVYEIKNGKVRRFWYYPPQ